MPLTQQQRADIKVNSDKVIVDKISELRRLLEATIPYDGMLPSSEQKYKPIFNETNRNVIKRKIFELINKL